MVWNKSKLQKQYQSKKKLNFLFFWGHQKAKDHTISKSCFSQWWSCQFKDEAYTYYSAEQYMMSEKAKLFNDTTIREQIIDCRNPKQIKALGRQIQHFDQSIWDKNKYDIVVQGNLLKFSQNPSLKKYLQDTKNKILVEASPVDKIWGIGRAEEDPKSMNPLLWKGENLLGFALMEVRELLNKEKNSSL
ncbi:NADAR family protein [Isobaculum melis]|uniref:NADAR domain-containing protein n=1 Tax=Isobaculum melis TaxID=142588 RepID=A0A1H9U5M0_9LACT|nr:NADAR family protein [Isobaculum melis]SES04464.1 hypothetical protein SAMN04488559_12148 [Isobaculum melis]